MSLYDYCLSVCQCVFITQKIDQAGGPETFFQLCLANIIKISLSVQKFSSFILLQRNQKSIELTEFHSCFCEMREIRKHGGFLQSQSHGTRSEKSTRLVHHAFFNLVEPYTGL